MTEAPTAQQPAAGTGPRRRHPVARAFGLVLGWACTALAALGLLAHVLDTSHQSLIVLASGAWVLAPLSVVALGLHLWRRAWFAAAAAVVVVVLQVVVYAPLYVADTAPTGATTTLRVMTQNLLYGQADPSRVVEHVRSADVDVFVAQELTSTEVARFRAAGLDRVLPYSVVDPRPQSPGTGIWSRYPIEDQQALPRIGLAGVSGRITPPGGPSIAVVTVHPSAPFPQDPSDWFADLDRVRTFLRTLPAGPAIVGGDFNATMDNARFRRILVDGWRDGAEQAGSGVMRSWPSDLPLPALVGIDHVLTRGAVATSVRTVPAPGSDHLGLLATVVVPR